MIKNVHLAVFTNEYGKKPYEPKDLIVFKDIIELDRFTDYFYNDNKAIRKEFEEDISEHFLDNMKKIKEIEERIGKSFPGRLTAYYYDKNGEIQFLELQKEKKHVVRDYKEFSDINQSINFLYKLFDETVKKINEQYQKTNYGPTKAAFIHKMCTSFEKYSYEFSDEEIYSLVKYYNHSNEKNKKDCLTLIKTNVKRAYVKKEENKVKKSSSDKKILHDEELSYSHDAPEKLQYDVEDVKKTGDYDNLFLNHDLDEIDKYTNISKKGR